MDEKRKRRAFSLFLSPPFRPLFPSGPSQHWLTLAALGVRSGISLSDADSARRCRCSSQVLEANSHDATSSCVGAAAAEPRGARQTKCPHSISVLRLRHRPPSTPRLLVLLIFKGNLLSRSLFLCLLSLPTPFELGRACPALPCTGARSSAKAERITTQLFTSTLVQTPRTRR